MNRFVKSRPRRSKGRESAPPWIEIIPGAAAGLVLGTFLAFAAVRSVGGVTQSPVPLPDSWTYQFTGATLLATAAVGAATVVGGLLWRFDRQFLNWLVVGAGAGLAVLGTSGLALERIDIDPEGVAVRCWWGLSRTRVRFEEIQVLREIHHQRQPGFCRVARGPRVVGTSLRIVDREGVDRPLLSSSHRNRLSWWGQLHVVQAARRAGVELKKESDS